MGLSLPKSNLIFLKKCLDKWVHFIEAQYPVSVLLEMHKYGLLEHMFIGPAIVPN